MIRIARHIALVAGLALAGGAHALPMSFTASLTLHIGTLSPVVSPGSGVGDLVDVGTGAFTVPAGVFAIGATRPLPTQFLGTFVTRSAVAGPGQKLAFVPLAVGANRQLTFDGVTGRMGLDASVYYVNRLGRAITQLPIGRIGVGGTTTQPVLGGLVTAVIRGNPYGLGRVTVAGGLATGVPATLVATGYDNRSGITPSGLRAGAGTLQLVSPGVIEINAGTIPMLAVLTLTTDGVAVPEPATALLLGAGLGALAMLSRPRR
jgi:hypothetical protein